MEAKAGHVPRWGSRNFILAGMMQAEPPAFEKVANRLKLNRSQYQTSSELRSWVRMNYQHRYVPEDLLEAMGLEVL